MGTPDFPFNDSGFWKEQTRWRKCKREKEGMREKGNEKEENGTREREKVGQERSGESDRVRDIGSKWKTERKIARGEWSRKKRARWDNHCAPQQKRSLKKNNCLTPLGAVLQGPFDLEVGRDGDAVVGQLVAGAEVQQRSNFRLWKGLQCQGQLPYYDLFLDHSGYIYDEESDAVANMWHSAWLFL